jgi:hypothetical protein
MSLVYVAAKPIGDQPLPDLVPIVTLGALGEEDLYKEYGNRVTLDRNGPQVRIFHDTGPMRTGISCGSSGCDCTRNDREEMVEFNLDAVGIQIDLGHPMPEIRLRVFANEEDARTWLASG